MLELMDVLRAASWDAWYVAQCERAAWWQSWVVGVVSMFTGVALSMLSWQVVRFVRSNRENVARLEAMWRRPVRRVRT